MPFNMEISTSKLRKAANSQHKKIYIDNYFSFLPVYVKMVITKYEERISDEKNSKDN